MKPLNLADVPFVLGYPRTILQLHGSFEPPLQVEEDPWDSLCACQPRVITSACEIESKKPLISRSITQSCRQHRCLAAATASSADLPGRYPYESRWKVRLHQRLQIS